MWQSLTFAKQEESRSTGSSDQGEPSDTCVSGIFTDIWLKATPSEGNEQYGPIKSNRDGYSTVISLIIGPRALCSGCYFSRYFWFLCHSR